MNHLDQFEQALQIIHQQQANGYQRICERLDQLLDTLNLEDSFDETLAQVDKLTIK